MKKIGILTFHCADNYGAVLQCYAMQHYLKKCGYNAEIINYVPSYIEEKYRVYTPLLKTITKYKMQGLKFPLLSALRTYCNNIYFLKRYKKHNSFEKFRRQHLHLSKICRNHKTFVNIAKEYDVITVGSDQVWSKRIAGGAYDKVYFLDGVDNKVTRMTFAASAGDNIAEEDIKEVTELLENFDFISTREEVLANQLSEIAQRDCVGVMDPVFLLNKESWLESFSDNNLSKSEKYIFVYNVSSESNVNEYFSLVDEVAEYLGCKVYEIGKSKHCKSEGKVFDCVGPEKFIALIEGAEFVFTTSFHATAIAIILEKQFNVFLPNNAQRITSILEQFGLPEKLIYPNGKPDYTVIDYEKMRDIKNVVIGESKDYLDNCIKNV